MLGKLKEKGVEVFFEKENLWTLDSKSELILTIMASIAQEESRSLVRTFNGETCGISNEYHFL